MMAIQVAEERIDLTKIMLKKFLEDKVNVGETSGEDIMSLPDVADVYAMLDSSVHQLLSGLCLSGGDRFRSQRDSDVNPQAPGGDSEKDSQDSCQG